MKTTLSKMKIEISQGKKLFLMAMPLLVIVFVFSYLPLVGWSIAFFDYRPGMQLTADNFAGFRHFRMIIQDRHALNEIIRVMTNTLAMSFLGILGSVFPVIFAVMLNEIANRPFKRIVQTLVTLPNFISWILVFAVVWAMFSVGDGFVNRLLVHLGLTRSGINFMASQNNVWVTQWLYSVWKTLGWSMIIYLAAIAGIDQEMYEAARIDGASRFKIILHITIPALMPTFCVLLLLAIANIINNGMEQYFVFQNPMNRARIEVLDLYVYNQGMLNARIPYSTAIGMLRSLISVILLFAANRGVKLVRGEGIV